jgi:hypothetical protein
MARRVVRGVDGRGPVSLPILQIAGHRFPDRPTDPAKMNREVDKFTRQGAVGGFGLSARPGRSGRAADLLLERTQ